MEEIFKGYSVDEILLYGIFIGMLFNVIDNMIYSLMDYLNEKSWLVRDYERIIAQQLYPEYLFYDEDKEIVLKARNNYFKKLKKRKNTEKFLNKFKFKKK